MSQFFKNLKKEVIVSSLIYIIVGAIFLFYPAMSANIIAYILGGTILAFGVNRLYQYHRLEHYQLSNRIDLLIGAIALGVGVFVIFNPGIVISILPFICGIFMVIEAFSLLQSAQDLKTDEKAYHTSLILMIILFVGGITILINPFKAGTTVLMVIGAFFIFDGVSQLWSMYQIKKKIHPISIERK